MNISNCRKTDHDYYIQLDGILPILPASYFLEAANAMTGALDLSSNEVVFVLCSDDPGWTKANVINRAEAKMRERFHLVTDVNADPAESTGFDLATLAACNHTILSWGTFSFWAGFFAGGLRITPAMILKDRATPQRIRELNEDMSTMILPDFGMS